MAFGVERMFLKKYIRIRPIIWTPLWLALQAPASESPTAGLIHKVIENQKKNRRLQTSYIFEMNLQVYKLEKDGKQTIFRDRAFEIVPLESGDYHKLIRKDGKPLPEKELQKEQEKLAINATRQANLSTSQKAKLEKERQARLKKEDQAWNDVMKAFDITLDGQDHLEGRPVTILSFTPRSGYVPSGEETRLLKQIKGKAWIDDEDFQIVRLDAEMVEDLKFGGGFLAKIKKGGTLSFFQRKINQEVWFPFRSESYLNARILLVKGFNLKVVNEFANYRKYETSVKITPVSEP
jgi:hypothetical protein